MLELYDSPIRKKVSFKALDPGKILPRSNEEKFLGELANENLASYGPVSKEISKKMEENC